MADGGRGKFSAAFNAYMRDHEEEFANKIQNANPNMRQQYEQEKTNTLIAAQINLVSELIYDMYLLYCKSIDANPIQLLTSINPVDKSKVVGVMREVLIPFFGALYTPEVSNLHQDSTLLKIPPLFRFLLLILSRGKYQYINNITPMYLNVKSGKGDAVGKMFTELLNKVLVLDQTLGLGGYNPDDAVTNLEGTTVPFFIDQTSINYTRTIPLVFVEIVNAVSEFMRNLSINSLITIDSLLEQYKNELNSKNVTQTTTKRRAENGKQKAGSTQTLVKRTRRNPNPYYQVAWTTPRTLDNSANPLSTVANPSTETIEMEKKEEEKIKSDSQSNLGATSDDSSEIINMVTPKEDSTIRYTPMSTANLGATFNNSSELSNRVMPKQDSTIQFAPMLDTEFFADMMEAVSAKEEARKRKEERNKEILTNVNKMLENNGASNNLTIPPNNNNSHRGQGYGVHTVSRSPTPSPNIGQGYGVHTVSLSPTPSPSSSPIPQGLRNSNLE